VPDVRRRAEEGLPLDRHPTVLKREKEHDLSLCVYLPSLASNLETSRCMLCFLISLLSQQFEPLLLLRKLAEFNKPACNSPDPSSFVRPYSSIFHPQFSQMDVNPLVTPEFYFVIFAFTFLFFTL
jgi:hypothetical protein